MALTRYTILAIITFSFTFLSPATTNAATTTRDKLLSVYLFRLAEHVTWPNASEKRRYRIHLIDNGNGIERRLRDISDIKRLHGKHFIVSRSKDDHLPADSDIVFVPQDKMNLFKRVLDRIEQKSILLISENTPPQLMRHAMIDLRGSTSGKYSFKINKANIIPRGIDVDPDIVFLGGSEVDIAKLYQEGLRTLEAQTRRLQKLEQEIEVAQARDDQIKREMRSFAKERDDAIRKLSEVADKYADMTSKLSEADRNIETQKALISEQNLAINNRSETISKLKSTLQDYQNNITDKLRIIDSKEKEIRDASRMLHELDAKIVESEQILDEKTRLVEESAEQLMLQNQQLAEQQDRIDAQQAVITDQEAYLIFASTVAVLVLLLFLLAYRGYLSRKRSNEQLRHTAEKLEIARAGAEAATKAKSLFLSNMSHELRSPLTSIIGFSHLMHENPDISEEVRKNLGIIKRSADHLITIINDVLDMAKIELGKVELTTDDVELYALLRDTVDMLRMTAKSKDLYLDLNVSSDCPALIHTDSGKLRRIFINLINNAIKYTERGGVSVRVHCCDGDSSSSVRLECEVEDTGVGISSDKLREIFEPFEQIVENQKTGGWQQGTGLGLSVCRELVEFMGGKITVQSTPSQGSILSFFVIVERAIGVGGRTSFAPRVVVDSSSSNMSLPVKALIVEDISENAAYLHMILVGCGCEVECVEDGSMAVEKFISWKPDIIWMDRRMPRMDGVSATNRIRNKPGGEKVKIVAITASAFESEKEEIMSNGFDKFVRKPYLPSDVYDALSELLDIELKVAESTAEQESSERTNELNVEQIERLPDDIFEALKSASHLLDYDATLKVIESLKISDPEVADGISSLLDSYDFQRLQTLIGRSNR